MCPGGAFLVASWVPLVVFSAIGARSETLLVALKLRASITCSSSGRDLRGGYLFSHSFAAPESEFGVEVCPTSSEACSSWQMARNDRHPKFLLTFPARMDRYHLASLSAETPGWAKASECGFIGKHLSAASSLLAEQQQQ